jgi:hypothetical protein
VPRLTYLKYLQPNTVNGTMSPMTRFLSLGVVPALLVVNLACAVGCADRVTGSGVVKSEQREVSGFSDVKLRGSGELTIAVDPDGSESLVVEADDNLLPLLTSEVKDGALILGVRDNTNIHTTRPIRYRVTAKELNAIRSAGSGSIRASGIAAKKFSAEISGSGAMDLSGSADDAEFTISGSGSYEAAHLRAKTARVKISGSGDATVNASEQLEANIAGSGSVRYAGDPKVEKRIAGSGSVARR